MKQQLTTWQSVRKNGIAILLTLAMAAPAWATTNTVSLPAGFVRVTVPGNSYVLASMPFDSFGSNNVNTLFHGQLAGGTDTNTSDAILKWDASLQVYSNAYLVAGTADTNKDGFWVTDFASYTRSPMTFSPGEGFWLRSRQSATQTVFLTGTLVLDGAMSNSVYHVLTLMGYPYSSAIKIKNTAMAAQGALAGASPGLADKLMLYRTQTQSYLTYALKSTDTQWHDSTNWSAPVTEDVLGLGQGFWYNRLTNSYVWAESRPYADLFPQNANPPVITAMTVGTNGDALTLALATAGTAGETLELYYQDLAATNVFATTGWQIADTGLAVGGQSSITWTDSGPAARGKINTVYARYYIVGRGDIDSDGDALPDSRETFVYGSNPNESDSDTDGLPDGWEVSNGLNPIGGGATGIVGWWKLDETGGVSCVDSGTNGNNGTASGATVATGVLANARRFNGASDAISIANAAAYKPTSQLSVCAWANFTALYGNTVSGGASNGYQVLVAQRNTSSGFGYAIYKTPQHSLVFEIASAGSTSRVESAACFAQVGPWYQLMGTYDGTNMAFYANGQLIGTTARSGTLDYASGTGLLLGHGGLTVDGYFSGLLDDVRVYNVALAVGSVADIGEGGADNDADGLSNYGEMLAGTSAQSADSDGDGMPDGWEVANGLNTLVNDAAVDTDHDGVTNLQEYQNGSNPTALDTDADGIGDYYEIYISGTSPFLANSAGDGMADGWKLRYGIDSNSWLDAGADSDGDGLTNLQESLLGTNPYLADSDGDGTTDSAEVAAASDPLCADQGSHANGPALTVTSPLTGSIIR